MLRRAKSEVLQCHNCSLHSSTSIKHIQSLIRALNRNKKKKKREIKSSNNELHFAKIHF